MHKAPPEIKIREIIGWLNHLPPAEQDSAVIPVSGDILRILGDAYYEIYPELTLPEIDE